MIIEADVNGVKKTTVEDHYILVYEGLDMIIIQFNDNALTETIHNLEVFENGRELADRVLEIGLNFRIEHMLLAKEFGVSFQEENEQKFLDSIWIYGTEDEQQRAEALGYIRPQGA